MQSFNSIVKNIRDLKIQGATSIAISAVKAFELELKAKKSRSELLRSAQKLIKARATEPALRNALAYCLANYKTAGITKKAVRHFEDSRKSIIEIGAKRIKSGMTIFTHCHSSTVEKIIISAHKQGKKIQVRNTETRPKFQGRITATNIAKAKIPTEHFVDSAAIEAIRESDLFLFGCDAITSDGRIVNKIGTALMLEIAGKFSIPAYSCTDLWKFDPDTLGGKDEEIEQRNAKEVWNRAPRGIKIHNPAFEICSPDKITGIICELGIFKPETILEEIRNAYPWILG